MTTDTAELQYEAPAVPHLAVIRVGVTGHRSIPSTVLPYVRSTLRHQFSRRDVEWEAFSSLAAGADQLFADIALEHGVPVTAVIPGMDYDILIYTSH